MKLSAQITDTLKFALVMIIFSFAVFVGYSIEKKIVNNIRDGKGSQKIGSLSMNLHSPCDYAHYRM